MAGFSNDNKQGGVSRHYRPGLGNVGSYQVSSLPYITGSSNMGGSGIEHRHQFDNVAKSVTIINRSAGTAPSQDAMTADIRVHFNATGSGRVIDGLHYVGLENDGDSITLNMKCKEIYVSSNVANAAYTLIAELTNIPSSEMHDLTGSGLTTIT